jgi:hypothetical protein
MAFFKLIAKAPMTDQKATGNFQTAELAGV